jgi:putative nucleotidyltransferase with HDIG domain
MVAVQGVARVRKQSQPAIVGFYCGLVQALTIVSFKMLGDGFSFEKFRDLEYLREFTPAAWSFAGGVVCGAIVTTLLPAIELFLGVVTDRRLLDLADPGTNLLRVLRERAPGTFQHTLGVQQLARAGAEAIGADALLADVGAYYHDIGKIYKPEYFVENMGEDKTIHDRLRPSMSKLIINSHVKDGIELAREEKLPQQIIDMIPMHHGTTVVEFFYRKAQRESGDVEDNTPGKDVEYRYAGPKPAFREAGIVMLADAVEAIAKTITEPTSNRFRDMVRGVIHKRLLGGELDDCNLTMADLHKIEDSFVKTLTTMYHGRIKYPGNPAKQPSPTMPATSGSTPEKVGSK